MYLLHSQTLSHSGQNGVEFSKFRTPSRGRNSPVPAATHVSFLPHHLFLMYKILSWRSFIPLFCIETNSDRNRPSRGGIFIIYLGSASVRGGKDGGAGGRGFSYRIASSNFA